MFLLWLVNIAIKADNPNIDVFSDNPNPSRCGGGPGPPFALALCLPFFFKRDKQGRQGAALARPTLLCQEYPGLLRC